MCHGLLKTTIKACLEIQVIIDPLLTPNAICTDKRNRQITVAKSHNRTYNSIVLNINRSFPKLDIIVKVKKLISL